MFCPNCGNQMNEGAKFCSNCGWSEGQTSGQSNFNIGNLKSKFGGKPVFIVAGLIVLFIIFKAITSFGDVASFAKEVKTVEKQLKEGDYASVLRNNFDYTGSNTSAEEAIQSLNNSSSGYGGISASALTSLLKGSELEKKLEKVYKEAEKAIALKYSVKKVDKGKVRLTLKFNLPRPTVLNNNKIGEKLSQFLLKVVSASATNMYSGNYMNMISQLTDFDKPAIEIIKIYKSLGKDVKQDFDIYIDFYKIDGHWRYKLSEADVDGIRLSNAFSGWGREWSNASDILESFISRYNLNF